MAAILPINVENLLHRRSVESARVEFKAGWDEKTTGPQVVKTICAFANDFQNLNGGYVVLGVRELEGGVAELPPVGLEPAAAEVAEKWIRGHCQAMRPAYEPVFSREWMADRLVLVIWASASAERPHQAPNAPKPSLRGLTSLNGPFPRHTKISSYTLADISHTDDDSFAGWRMRLQALPTRSYRSVT